MANKIRVAFIDEELARRRNTAFSSFNDSQQHRMDLDDAATTLNDARLDDQKTSTTNPAVARQLAEVDLGSSAQAVNLARTQAALERAKAGQAPVEDEVKPPKPRKPRLGRDGKAFRPRPRKCRNSKDITRDALVEQFLHENKIDLYDTNTSEPTSGRKPGDDSADEADADERFAEQFRQEFMDAMAEKRSGKNKPVIQAKGAAVTEARGPKLGGSRSARAKMAQLQQSQQAPTPGKK